MDASGRESRPHPHGASRTRQPGTKNFHLTDRARLDFRAEAFNLMNTPAFGFPGATVGTGAFGVISSTLSGTDARQLQFALKLNF
jgi:hypothetical protein